MYPIRQTNMQWPRCFQGTTFHMSKRDISSALLHIFTKHYTTITFEFAFSLECQGLGSSDATMTPIKILNAKQISALVKMPLAVQMETYDPLLLSDVAKNSQGRL